MLHGELVVAGDDLVGLLDEEETVVRPRAWGTVWNTSGDLNLGTGVFSNDGEPTKEARVVTKVGIGFSSLASGENSGVEVSVVAQSLDAVGHPTATATSGCCSLFTSWAGSVKT